MLPIHVISKPSLDKVTGLLLMWRGNNASPLVVDFAAVGLGTILALSLILTDWPNPLLYLQADLGSIVFGLGVLISILVAVVIVILDQIEKIQINATIEFAEDRRRFLRRLDHELKNPLTAILAGLANLSILDDPEERA